MIKISFYKKITLYLAVGIVVFAILTPGVVHAAASNFDGAPVLAGECFASGFFGNVLCGASMALQSLTLGFFYAVGKLFAVMLSGLSVAAFWAIKTLGFDIATHPAVSIGFGISLQIANVVFVIAIIAIAFATILRWKEYEAKKLLSKLILATLLVNFSLLIAGVMLDASNVFTLYFISQDKVNAEGIGEAFSPQIFNIGAVYGGGATYDDDALFKNLKARYTPLMDNWDNQIFGNWYSRLARLVGTKEIVIYEFGYGRGETARDRFKADLDNKSPELLRRLKKRADRTAKYVGGNIDIGIVWSEFLSLIPKVIFSVFMTGMAMITMLAVFLMAVIRSIWVVVLLIAMPLAWALSVIPKFQQYWQLWWEKFLNWGVIYLPTVSFFLYIAIQTAIKTRGTTPGAGFEEINVTTADFLGTSNGIGPTVLESTIIALIVMGLMIAGLKIAQAMGATGAGLAMKLGGKVGKTLTRATVAAATIPFGVGVGLFRGSWKGMKIGFRSPVLGGAAVGAAVGAVGGAVGGIFSGAKFGFTGGGGNLYSKGTEYLSRKAAALSFLPGMTSVAGFLAKTSAAQNAKTDEALKETTGYSRAATEAWIKAARFKDDAHKVAAAELAHKMEIDLPEGSLKSFADAVVSFNRGVDREKIPLLKALAEHNPTHAHDITGEETADVAQRADTSAIQSLADDVYKAIEPMLGANQRLARAGKDARAQAAVVAGLLESLRGSLNVLPQLMRDDVRAVIDGQWQVKGKNGKTTVDQNLMKRLSGHLETIKNDAQLKQSLGNAAGAVEEARSALRVQVRTKSKAEHGAHADPSYGIGALLVRGLKAVVSSNNGGGSKPSTPKNSGGSGGHGH